MKTIIIVVGIALVLFFGQRYLVNKKKPKKKTIKQKPYTPETIEYSGNDKEFHDRVNDHRIRDNTGKVISDRILTEFAVKHCKYMVSKDKASHDFGLKRADDIREYGFKKVGECTTTWRGGIKRTFDAYLRSKGHRETIEDKKYTHFGSHTIIVNNKIFNCMIFANRKSLTKV